MPESFAGLKPTWGPWTRCAGTLAGVVLGIGGTLAAWPDRNGAGLVVSFVACAILLAVFASLPERRTVGTTQSARPTRSRIQLTAAGTLLALAVHLPALVAFHDGRNTVGWLLWLIAQVILVGAFLPLTGRSASGRLHTSRKTLWLAIVLLIALALLPRLHLITSFPYGVWFDEAQNGLVALRIHEDPDYRPVFVADFSQMPALLFYYLAAFLAVAGRDILAIRLAITLLGVLSVVATWLLARELFGLRVAWIAAVLLAFCRWHIGFSRFGMAILLPTLFIPLTLWLFVLAQERKSPLHGVLAGISMGLGLQTYYSVLAAPVLVVLWFFHRFIAGRWRSAAAPALLGVTLFAAALAYAPVFQYSRQHPEQFAQRLATVSIIKASSPGELVELLRGDEARSNLLRTLKSNAVKHLRMFHLQGDPNGRHNLPGEPMLDPVTGLFFAVGALWCLALVLRPDFALLLLWGGAMLSAGILSLDFEAPQGARSSGITPVIAIMAALPLARASRAVALPLGRPLSRHAVQAVFACVLLALAAAWNWTTYFGRQRWDPAVWAAYSTPETKIAEVARDAGEDVEIYVPATFLGGPTQTFLFGREIRAHPFESATDLPLAPDRTSAIVFLPGSALQSVERFRRFYPQAELEPFGPPRKQGGEGEPILWIARVSADQVAALGRWRMLYRHQDVEEERWIEDAVWDWKQAPVERPFEVQVNGFLRVDREGVHAFELEGRGGEVAVDGEAVLLPSADPQIALLRLAPGNHRVSIELEVGAGDDSAALLWRPPGAGTATPVSSSHMLSPRLPIGGLLGSYHRGPSWEGSPEFQRVDSQIAFYFHQLPLPRPFSIRWNGSIYAPASGPYSFFTTSIDDSFVRVAGVDVVARRSPASIDVQPVMLEEGWHPIEVRYLNRSDYAQLYLYWTPPGAHRQLVPSEVLRPAGPSQEPVLLQDPPAALPRLTDRGTASPPSAPLPAVEDEGVAGSSEALVAETSFAIDAEAALRLAAGEGEWLYVLDTSRRAVQVTSRDRREKSIPLVRTDWRLEDPSDLVVGPRGDLYVLDAKGSIAVLSPEGELRERVDLVPLAVYNPRGLAVKESGDLVIADTGGGRILLCDRSAALLQELGRRGRGPGELLDPISVTVDGEGRILVVDAGNARIQAFSENGGLVGLWRAPTIQSGPLSPQLAVDADGRAWLAGGEAPVLYRVPARSDQPLDRWTLSRGSTAIDLAFAGPDTVLLLVRAGGARIDEIRLTGIGTPG